MFQFKKNLPREGVAKATVLEEKYGAKLDYLEGGGSVSVQKTFCRGRYEYFLEPSFLVNNGRKLYY